VDDIQNRRRVVIVCSAGKLYSSADWELSFHDSIHALYQLYLLHPMYRTVFHCASTSDSTDTNNTALILHKQSQFNTD
jgi:hypothetical protein